VPYSQEELDEFVRDPRESLDTELKGWIDPASNEGTIKIAKAVIALFNNNGGRLIVGINDDGTPDTRNGPADVRKSFHPDVVQGIATKFASQAFEVTVEFGQRDGHEYPISMVRSGVETPVCAKRDLVADDRSKIKSDTVYVRTLNSNNTVSTAAACAKDWPRLAKITFDNRESDIGAFFRRHIGQFKSLGFFGGSPHPRDPTPIEEAINFLDVGKTQYVKACTRFKQRPPTGLGTREVAFVIAGDVPKHSANEAFLRQLEMQKPNHTGRTPWIVSQGRYNDPMNPYVLDGGQERLMFELSSRASGGPHVDFWRIEPQGKFYHLRGLEDDLPDVRTVKPKPGTQIDFFLQISRIAEIISIAQSFARSIGCDESVNLVFAFRWAGLLNRDLVSWVAPGRTFHSRGTSQQNEITTDVIVPLETPPSALAPHVEVTVDPLFALFGGMKFESSVIEGIVNETVKRRL